MRILKLPVEIDDKIVLEYLGYKDSAKAPFDVLGRVEKCIKKSLDIIESRVCYDKLKFDVDLAARRLIFPNGEFFSGDYVVKKLAKADYLILVVATIGKQIERLSTECFSKGHVLDALIFDCIGNVALDSLMAAFWSALTLDAKRRGFGVTNFISPGQNVWDIREQAVIFKLIDPLSIGVRLNESLMMSPEKSLAVVCGVGKKIKTAGETISCDECGMENCSYKKKNGQARQVKIYVYFGNEKKQILARQGENLFEILTKNNLNIPGSCGGKHTCGKCKVKIKTKNQLSIMEEERHFLNEHDIKNHIRLACFCDVNSDMAVFVPQTNPAKILVKSEGIRKDSFCFNPRIKRANIATEPPSIDDQRDDLTKLKHVLGAKHLKVPVKVLKELPEVMRKSDFDISGVIRGNELLSMSNSHGSDMYGVAVDIGTTTLVAYLVDMATGQQKGVYSCLNPQRIYGADVISRINHTIEADGGLERLNNLMIKEINAIIEYFCNEYNMAREHIYEMTFVGNTTMIHLLLGVSCKGIASAPYNPAFLKSFEIKAKELGIKINPEGYIITLPLISGFIGGDTIGCILASRMYADDKISLLFDIGTNGEMVIGNKQNMLACSMAAGPALEGANITFGTGGIEGAIDSVDFGEDVLYTTINDADPIGICGSGVIDIIAQLLRYGIIDNTGKFKSKQELENINHLIRERLIDFNGIKAFLIDEKSGICFTQRDIREVQLAKAAIYAGIKILTDEMGVSFDEINKVFLAGGFGNYINVKNAAAIGLIPRELQNKVIPIGNGAGIGAINTLISHEELKATQLIKDKIEYIELSTTPSFEKIFINSMSFNYCL